MSKTLIANVVAGAAALVALAGPAVVRAQESPRITTGRNGENVVAFRNDCRVFYDADGRYLRRNDNCSREQQRSADVAIARYRRDQGPGTGRPPGRRPDRDNNSSWSAGSGSRVFENIDARGAGAGRTDMRGIKGNGSFANVRARVGTGGDVIVDIADPTDGQIRGTVRGVDGATVRLNVTSVYGYRASGTMTIDLTNANAIRAISGSGSGDRGRWSLNYPANR